MRKILKQPFFERDARVVAQELLGKYLVRRYRGKERAYKIVETEAYVGPHDKASHAHKGRTKRTEVMFGHAGVWYVYFIYGMYNMLNIVTGRKDYPSAVLIRSIQLADNHSNVLQNIGMIDGPGKLTKTLKITRALNTKKATKVSCLWIEDRGEKVPKRKIQKTPRIGVSYAGEWADKPYRFILEEN